MALAGIADRIRLSPFRMALVICISSALFPTLGFGQVITNFPANHTRIHYEPPLLTGKRVNNDPNDGWIIGRPGGQLVSFTSNSSAIATFTFFGASIQVFTGSSPLGTNSSNTSISLDGNTTIVNPPHASALLFSAMSLDPAIPHTVIVSKSGKDSNTSVAVLSSFSVGNFTDALSSNSSPSSPSPTPTSTTDSASSRGGKTKVVVAIAVSSSLAVVLIIVAFHWLRHRRRRLGTLRADPHAIDTQEAAHGLFPNFKNPDMRRPQSQASSTSSSTTILTRAAVVDLPFTAILSPLSLSCPSFSDCKEIRAGYKLGSDEPPYSGAPPPVVPRCTSLESTSDSRSHTGPTGCGEPVPKSALLYA